LGLARVLEIIWEPGTRLKLSEPHIMASYWNHCWKELLGEVLEMWTPTDVMSVDISVPVPGSSASVLLS